MPDLLYKRKEFNEKLKSSSANNTSQEEKKK